jgi:hypothetical protein
MSLRPRQRNRRNVIACGTSKTIAARSGTPRARSRGRAGSSRRSSRRPNGAAAGQQASRFTPFSKPWEPGTSGYGSRRTRSLADMEVA